MGRTVTTIGQHTLNIQEPKLLMKELAVRFDTNVYYCFSSPYNWTGDRFATLVSHGIDEPEKYLTSLTTYVLDQHLIPGNTNTMVLVENDYCFKWMYHQYGMEAGYREEFITEYLDDPEENNEIIKEYLADELLIDFYFKNTSGTLSLESARVGYDYFFCEWSFFHNVVLRTCDGIKVEDLVSVLGYRNTNMNTIKKLGGNCMYYVEERGEHTGYNEGEQWGKSWEEIVASYATENVKNHQVNLCDAFTNLEYLKQLQDKLEFQDFSVFYDDFREIGNNVIKVLCNQKEK